MMISPEAFYEENLKGKSAGEILRVIKSLKREINRLKKIAESNDVLPEKMIDPDPLTQIKVYRDYLEGCFCGSRRRVQANEGRDEGSRV